MINIKRKSVIKNIILAVSVVVFVVINYLLNADIIKNDKLKVTFLNIGQGDCAVIEYSDKVFMIDCGEEQYSNQIVRFLKEKEIDKIDGFFFSHEHSDHIGSAADVLSRFEVIDLYMSENCYKYINNAAMYDVLKETLKEYSLNVIYNEITTFSSGAVEFTVYKISESDDINEQSLIVLMKFGDTSFLFTGDISSDTEKKLIEQYDINADVIKLAHHGSKSSSAFSLIDETAPEIVVVSCGKHNQYGHPDSEVTDMLTGENIKYYRTDVTGNVVIVSDGKKVFKGYK